MIWRATRTGPLGHTKILLRGGNPSCQLAFNGTEKYKDINLQDCLCEMYVETVHYTLILSGSKEEIKRLEAIFYSHALRPEPDEENPKPKLGISRSVFVSEIMDVGLPEKIVERFYILFKKDTTQKYLPWKQFVRGLVCTFSEFNLFLRYYS